MGGRAFPHLHVPLLLPAEYERIRDECTKTLQQFYAQVVCPAEAPEKADHGDVDFLVSDPIKGFSLERLKHALKVVEETGHKPKSFAVPLSDESKTSYAQIDINFCDNTDLQWEIWMSAYGDLFQIISLLLQPIGLRMTDKGLFLRLKLSTLESSPIFLIKDAAKVREFLGLNEEGYQRGYRTVEELFEWCSRGRFFRAPSTEKKPRGRWMFDHFLLWAPSQAELWASHTSASWKEVFDLAVVAFDVEQQVRLQRDRDHKLTAIVAAISESEDNRKKSKLPKLERWIRFQGDGLPMLRPISGEHEPVPMSQSTWLDSIRDYRLAPFLNWLKASLTELERRDKVWIAKKKLNSQLTDALHQFVKKGDQKSGKVNSERFKKEFLECDTLDPASEDSKLLERYHWCKKLIDDMTTLDLEEELYTMIEELTIL